MCPTSSLLSARRMRCEPPHTTTRHTVTKTFSSPLRFCPSTQSHVFRMLAHACSGVRRRYAAVRTNRLENRGMNCDQEVTHSILSSYIKNFQHGLHRQKRGLAFEMHFLAHACARGMGISCYSSLLDEKIPETPVSRRDWKCEGAALRRPRKLDADATGKRRA